MTFCLNIHTPLLQLGCCLNYPPFLSAGKTYPKTGQAVIVHYTGKLHGSKGKEEGEREKGRRGRGRRERGRREEGEGKEGGGEGKKGEGKEGEREKGRG